MLKEIINVVISDYFLYLCTDKKKTKENMRKEEKLHIVYNNLAKPLINRDFFAAAQAAVEE